MKLAEFNDLWKIDAAPACPLGMALLNDWADTLPPVTDLRRLAPLAPEEGIHSDETSWLAIEKHLSKCADCNEMDR